MARVQLKNVEKTFNKNKVLKGINVEVHGPALHRRA